MKTYTQEFREKAVADCLASGMSQPKFAEKIGVSLSTLKSWIYSRPDCRPVKFVDLTVAAGPDPAGGKPAGGKTVEIIFSGAGVLVVDGYAGYDDLPNEKQMCWTHIRRKFWDIAKVFSACRSKTSL